MSITISTIAADARTRSRRPVEARFDAVSSALGAVSPAAISARAVLDRLRVLDEGAPQRRRRDDPQDDRRDHPSVPDVKGVAQDREPDPEGDRADQPDDRRDGAHHRDSTESNRLARSMNREKGDNDDPRHDERAHERCCAQQVEREDPILEGHANLVFISPAAFRRSDAGAMGSRPHFARGGGAIRRSGSGSTARDEVFAPT